MNLQATEIFKISKMFLFWQNPQYCETVPWKQQTKSLHQDMNCSGDRATALFDQTKYLAHLVLDGSEAQHLQSHPSCIIPFCFWQAEAQELIKKAEFGALTSQVILNTNKFVTIFTSIVLTKNRKLMWGMFQMKVSESCIKFQSWKKSVSFYENLCIRKMPEPLSRNLIKESEQDLGKLAIHKEQCGHTAAKIPT